DLYRVARHGRFGAHGERVLPNYNDMDAAEMEQILSDNADKFMFRAGMDFGFVTSYNALYRVAVDKKEQHLYIYWEYY
ncbi:PBSX family phage terminase large subunit, partial [Bacillus cereus]